MTTFENAVVEGPRPIRAVTTEGVRAASLSAGLALAAVGLLFVLTPLAGAFGFVLITFAVFLTIYYFIVRSQQGRKQAADRVASAAISAVALMAATPLVLIVWTVTKKAWPGLSLHLLRNTMERSDPSNSLATGGLLHALLGSVSQVLGATLVAVPFGVLTAVYLHEIRGVFAPYIRVIVDAMSGIPSIVAGLFIYTIWVLGPGKGFSGLAAALALGVLMLPTVARTTEEMLKLVDPGLREASLALGSPQWRTILQVVLPTARTGIITATILGIARVAGETAPLLMTAFGADRIVSPIRATHDPQSALPLFVYQQFAQDHRELAWAGAFILIVLVLVLFSLARLLGRKSGRRAASR